MPSAALRLSGLLLIAAFVLNMGGVVLFSGSQIYRWFIDSPTLLAWERSMFIAAYVAAALGIGLLEMVLRDTSAAVLARLGSTAFLMAAVVALVVEAAFLGGRASTSRPVNIMVVLLFVAEATLGAALLRSGAVRAWIGLAVLVWNVGWLVVLPVVSPGDIYYPILHFVPLLLIGIPPARAASVLSS
jgi:hypothetical protein